MQVTAQTMIKTQPLAAGDILNKGSCPATMVEFPVYDPNKERVRAM